SILYLMVKNSSDSLGAVFAALADPTRRAIAERLTQSEEPVSMSDLAEPFAVTLPAVLKHLRVLEDAGLIEHRKQGRTRYFRFAPGSLDEADRWISFYRTFWSDRFAELRKHLDQGDAG